MKSLVNWIPFRNKRRTSSKIASVDVDLEQVVEKTRTKKIRAHRIIKPTSAKLAREAK